jgi:predicted Zn-dependent protease
MRRLILAALALLLLAATPAWAQRLVVIRDAETEAMLRAVSAPLFRAAGLNPGLVRLIILQDRAINAFVTTGNRMVIHSGLITATDGVGELAGVLAHETGHVSGTHIARLPDEIEKAMATAILGMLLGGAAAIGGSGSGALGAATFGQALAQRQFFAFTRAQENAADQAGLTYLDRAGWSARGLATLFRRLADQEALPLDLQDPYMRTHPLTRERIATVNEAIARSRFSDTPMPDVLEHRFQMVRAKLMAFTEDNRIVTRRLEGRDDAPATYARAIMAWRAGRLAEATPIIDRLIAADRANPYLHEMKGQMLFESGRVADAIPAYREAARLAPGEPQIRLALGRALLDLNESVRLREAQTEIEASLRLERGNALAWRQMGLIWTRLGNEGQASLALAEESRLRGDFRQALRAAARAEALLPPGPARLQAQDIANEARVAREEFNRR